MKKDIEALAADLADLRMQFGNLCVRVHQIEGKIEDKKVFLPKDTVFLHTVTVESPSRWTPWKYGDRLLGMPIVHSSTRIKGG